MNTHDAITDDGTRVVCACGKSFEGPRARDHHLAHFRVAELRAVLEEAKEKAGQ